MEMLKVTDQNKYLLLQVNDSLFPIGSYSHSYGLETYIQKGLVTDIASAEEYIRNTILYNMCYTDLLAVHLSYEYAKQEQHQKALELDILLNALKTPQEIRGASQKLGARFIKTVNKMDIKYMNDSFQKYVSCDDKKIKKHHVTAYGTFAGALEADYNETIITFLYAQVSGIVTNCVKLIPLSQTNGQQLLTSCFPIFSQVIEKLAECSLEELGMTTPGFDIRCMQHERLYSRLYMS